MTTWTDIGIAGRDPIPTVIAAGVTVKVTHEGVVIGPITKLHTAAHHTHKLKHIPLPTRHSTQKIVIMQKFIQGLQQIQTMCITQTQPQNIIKTVLQF